MAKEQQKEVKEFGIWGLPATMGAVRLAAESMFTPPEYDAAEREAKLGGSKEITRQHIERVLRNR